MATPSGEITKHLQDWNEGDPGALGEVMELAHEELRGIARICFERESANHTLQPTAVVNELYLKFAGQKKSQWHNRAEFFGVAAGKIRRILIDYARKRDAGKRGGDVVKVPLPEDFDLAEPRGWDLDDLIALDRALAELTKLDARQSRLMEMRLFVGMTLGEICEVEGLARATVYRHLDAAQLFLKRELGADAK